MGDFWLGFWWVRGGGGVGGFGARFSSLSLDADTSTPRALHQQTKDPAFDEADHRDAKISIESGHPEYPGQHHIAQWPNKSQNSPRFHMTLAPIRLRF